ncbi:MAG TPA: response regulator [Lysobacter sp.]|nr:response regulator [Lysobacter sp.]
MDDATALGRLRGRRVLVVEDEYLVADDLRVELEQAGAHVVGPAPTIADALRLLAGAPVLDAAILDVNVGGEPVDAVALQLERRGVPFVLATGYDAWALPQALLHAPRCEKPVGLAALARALYQDTAG